MVKRIIQKKGPTSGSYPALSTSLRGNAEDKVGPIGTSMKEEYMEITEVEEIPIVTADVKEEGEGTKIQTVKTPTPTENEFNLQESTLSMIGSERSKQSDSRSSNKSSRPGSTKGLYTPTSNSRASTNSFKEDGVLQPVQYKGSFLDMAQKLLQGTLIGQEQNPLDTSEYRQSVVVDINTEQEQEMNNADLKAKTMLLKVQTVLTTPKQKFSTTVVIDSPKVLETTETMSKNIHKDICDFQNHCQKNSKCRNIPQVYRIGRQFKIKFNQEIEAFAFIAKHKGCYKSLHLNMRYEEQSEDQIQNLPLSYCSGAKYLPAKLGMCQRKELKTWLFSTISMETISCESVYSGRMESPIKINFLSRAGSVTKNVMPLALLQDKNVKEKLGMRLDSGNLFLMDTWIMNEVSDAPSQFLAAMIGFLAKNLKQCNQEALFDEAVLIFSSWKEVSIFVAWVQLADYGRILQNYVSYLGVVESGEGASVMKEISAESVFGRRVYQDLTQTKIPEITNCEEENLLIKAILHESFSRSRSFCQRFMTTNCADIETAFSKANDWAHYATENVNVCIVSMEYIKEGDNYFITQIGACIFNKSNLTGKIIKKLNFSVIIPDNESMEKDLVTSDLGITRNVDSGLLEFFHEQQKKSYPVVTEMNGLLDLFNFVTSNQELSGMKVSKTTLLTYSSYSSLPVLLQAVKRNNVEQQFYETFSSFTDFHTVASQIEETKHFFQEGIPSITKLAEELAGLNQSSMLHPANGMASLIFTLLQKLMKSDDKDSSVKTIHANSKSSAFLRFSRQEFLKYPLIAGKDLLCLSGKKGVISFDFALHEVTLEPNDLLVVTEFNIQESFELISKVASYEKLSLMLKNSTSKDFKLEKGMLFGYLISKPLPLDVPEVIPYLTGKQALGRYSTVESVQCNLRKQEQKKPSDVRAACIGNLEENLQNHEQNDSGNVPMVIQNYAKYIKKPIMQLNPPFMSLEEIQSSRPLVISIRTLNFGDKNQLVSLALYDLKEETMLLCKEIIPCELYNICPEDNNFQCKKCKSKPSFHFAKDCPLLEQCTLCFFRLKNEHKKSQCTVKDLCWNCGEEHIWRRCSKPLVNCKQRKFKDIGFEFDIVDGKKKVFYLIAGERVECYRDILVMKEFLKVTGESTVLIGYNITEILLDVFSCVLNMSKLRGRLQKNLVGIVDARWILGNSCRKMSLRDLLAKVPGRRKDTACEYLTHEVVKQISAVCFPSNREKKIPFAVAFTPTLLMNLLSNDINMGFDMFEPHEYVKQEVNEEVVEFEERVGDSERGESSMEEKIMDAEVCSAVNEKEIIVFIHLIVTNDENIEVLEQIDVLIAKGEKKQRYSQIFDTKTQNSEQASFFFKQLERGLSVSSDQKMTGVFICPESFRVFATLLESNTNIDVRQTFSHWVDLTSTFASRSTAFFAISYKASKLAELHLQAFGESLPMNKSKCEAMSEIFKAKIQEANFSQELALKYQDEEHCIVLINISVNWNDVTDSGVPQIDALVYQDMRGEEIVEHKALNFSGRTLLQEWRLKFHNKKVVLMSLQNDGTIPLVLANLLEHSDGTREELERLVAGVCDFRTFMAKMGEEDFFSSFQSLDSMPGAALIQLVTKILFGALDSPASYNNFLCSFVHKLDGPYFNRQLLNSELRIFNENQVRLVTSGICEMTPETIVTIAVRVVTPWNIPKDCMVKIISSSLPFIEVEVENLLDVSEKLTVDVEMLNVEFEDMTIPADTEVAKGEILQKGPSMNESKQKLFVRTDLLAETRDDLLTVEEDDKISTPSFNTDQDDTDEESMMLDRMSDNLVASRVGFFQMEH